MARSTANTVIAVLATLLPLTSAFYLPGVAPRQYDKGELLNIKVQTLSSTESSLEFDYYQLPFCTPDHEVEYAENLGEALLGQKSMSSMYLAPVLEDRNCVTLCKTTYDASQMEEFQDFSILNYHVNMRADNLPLAEVRRYMYSDDPTEEEVTFYALGYPIGALQESQSGQDTYFLNNHLRFKILYHPVEHKDEEHHGVYIVGFQVEPYSIAHRHSGDWNDTCVGSDNCNLETCVGQNALVDRLKIVPEQESTEVIWTYDIKWEESDVKWASRWDIFLKMTNDNIHWFGIVNSMVVLVFLTGIIGIIMMRILRKDFAMYNAAVDEEEDAAQLREETGWKLVYGDVFRPPTHPALLSALYGSGCQVVSMTAITLLFAVVGFLSPSSRGALMTHVLAFFVLMGCFGGYSAARMCKTLQEPNQFKVTMYTGIIFPGTVFCFFFIINLFVWAQGSSGAVPFGTLVALTCLWFGVTLPLVFLGSYMGFKKEAYSLPVRVNPIPRQVPPQVWYLRTVSATVLAGVLPFGVVFVELTVILGSMWQHRFYYMFGFLFLVFIVMVVTIAEVCIVLVYLQLCSENYNWWWRSYLAGGSVAIFLFLYSTYYYLRHVHLIGLGGMVSAFIHVGYTFILAAVFFVLCGFIGLASCFYFCRLIYGAVKID